jgi:hypothetical protein
LNIILFNKMLLLNTLPRVWRVPSEPESERIRTYDGPSGEMEHERATTSRGDTTASQVVFLRVWVYPIDVVHAGGAEGGMCVWQAVRRRGAAIVDRAGMQLYRLNFLDRCARTLLSDHYPIHVIDRDSPTRGYAHPMATAIGRRTPNTSINMVYTVNHGWQRTGVAAPALWWLWL